MVAALTPWQDPPDFAARLAIARARWHLSIPAAAEQCGLPASTWATWENRGVRPQDYEAITRKIADGLRCDLAWLQSGAVGGYLTLPSGL